MKKVWENILKSCYDHLGKLSQVRIQSYFILAEIIITGLFFLVIEGANAYLSIFRDGVIYKPSSESIVIFGMVLTHHLVMLGLKKGSESTPFPSLDNKNDNNLKLSEKPTYNVSVDSKSVDVSVEGGYTEPAKNLSDL